MTNMIRKIIKSDKSFAVVIPKEIAKSLRLKVGNYLDFKLVCNHIEAIPVDVKPRGR